MYYRLIRCLLLSILIVTATPRIWAQDAPLADCFDAQPIIIGPDVVREGQSVTYMTNAIPGHTYLWNLPAGGTIMPPANSNQITVLWGNNSTQTTLSVTEWNTSDAGCTGVVVSKDITIQPLLHAYFYYEFDPTGGCYFNVVNFTSASFSNPSDPITSYTWDFGDGTGSHPGTSLQQYTFPITGAFSPPYTFPVTLTVTNSSGTDAIIDYVYVDPDKFKPTAEVTSITPPTPNCLYNPYTFSATGSLPKPVSNPDLTIKIKYCEWYIYDNNNQLIDYILSGDGVTIPCPLTATYTFPSPGTYTINLVITNTINCENSATSTVVVGNTIPVAAFTFLQACMNEETPFTDISLANTGTITDWWWYWGDGSGTEHYNDPANLPPIPVTHRYTDLIQHFVSLKVMNSNGCENITVDMPIQAQPSPLADFTYPNVNCEGDVVQFTDMSSPLTGSPIATYLWDFGDPASPSNSSTDINPTHRFSGPGSFIITLTVVNQNGCANTKIVDPLVVSPHPDIDFSIAQGATSYDQIFTSIINPSQNVGNNVYWNFGDGNSGFGSPINHTYPGPGIYTVTCTAIDMLSGCSNTSEHPVMIGGPPAACFTANPPNQCQNVPMLFVPCPPGGLITTEDWDFGDGTFQHFDFPNVPASPTHSYLAPGPFHVIRVLNLGTPLEATFDLWVTIFDAPTADFKWYSDPAHLYEFQACDGQKVYFEDQSYSNNTPQSTIYQWLWNFDDPLSGANNTSALQNPSHTFMSGKTSYNVTLIAWENSQSCPSPITTKVVNINTPIPVDFSYTNNICINQNVDFTTDPLVLPPANYTWLWDFGDGFTSSSPGSVSHPYAGVGNFTVTLTLTDVNGCTKSKVHVVSIVPQPVANFTFTSPSCFGTAIQFTDLSFVPLPYNDVIVAWNWDFGDGGTATIQNPSYTYTTFSSSGYDVTLTVTTNRGCTQTKTIHVQQIAAPVANFQVTAGTFSCISPQSVRFTDLSQTNGGGNILYWYWDFGDIASGTSNYSTAQNPSHTYTTPGTKTVTLTVTNSNYCNHTFSQDIEVNGLPSPDFSWSTTCLNDPTTFTDLSVPNASGILTWSWNFGDGGTSTDANPIHTFFSAGIHQVTLTVTNTNGCVNSTTIDVTIFPLPVPEFSFSSPNCFGAAVTFTNQSTTVPGFLDNIVTWQWDFGDGVTQPPINWPANPNMTYTFAGTALSHTVTLTVTTSNGCSKSIQHIVNSIPAPIANFSFPAAPCEGNLVPFTDLSQANGGGTIVGWAWDFGDPGSGASNTSNGQNPSHTFSASGSFDVTLTVTNTNGCSNEITYPVTINAKPVADFSADEACMGMLTQFTDESTTSSGTIASRFWEFGDGGTGTGATPSHLYANSGNYSVKLTVTTSNGCVKDTTKQVIVYPALVAAFSYNSPACADDSVHFTDLSNSPHGYIETWLWNFGDGTPAITVNFPANPNVAHLYANGGTYTVTLTITNSDGCANTKTNVVSINNSPLANFSVDAGGCEQTELQFTDLSQQNGGGTIIGWNWDFRDPGSGTNNTSMLKNPTHAFSTSGTFNVLLVITNINGCVSADSMDVTINAAPMADFTADTACFEMPTNFTDESTTPSGTVVAWLWNFDDPSSGTNNSSTLQNPSHLFTNIGNYNVVLTVTNSFGCIHDTTFEIAVNPIPYAMFEYSSACIGSPTVFTDLSIAPGSTITNWYWDFGDGTGTATIQNPTYTYATAGTYNVQLTVTNMQNCTDSVIVPVIVRNNPTADFSYQNFFCPAGQVNFQDMSIGAGSTIIDRQWFFEPGYTATGPNPIHTFTQTDTTYAITLIVTDNFGCMDTIIDSVFVKPGFAFTYSNDTVCFGYPTHFQTQNLAEGDSLYSVAWNFGDPASVPNNTSFLYKPSHVFSAPGTYIVKLKAWNSDNCVDSIYQEVIVYDLPQPVFSFVSEPCDSIVDFTDLSLAGGNSIASWEWHFGDGTPPETILAPGPGSTTHLYPNLGIYNVTLVITNDNGCVDSITESVERYACISAIFTSDTLLCARNPILFADNSFPVTSITQWQWIFGDGVDTTYSSYTDTVAHEYLNAGDYVVKLIINAIVSGVSFTDSSYQIISIRPTPEAYFSNRSVCFNQSTLFIDTSNTFGDPNTSWYWNFGEPTSGILDTSTFENPSHNYMNTGYYNVQMIVENQWGCTDSITKPTRVFDIPIAGFESTAPCLGDPTEFTDLSTATDTTFGIWRWNFGVPGTKKDTSNLQDPSYTYDSLGTYTVRMIVQDLNGCMDTIDSTFTVNITPLSAFNITEYVDGMNGKLRMENLSTGANAFEWNFGNGKYSDEENPVISYTEDGTYIIELISLNEFGCSDTTFFQYELLFKGLYVPNAFAPGNTNLAVRLFIPVGINLKKYHVQVFNSSGHVMWESTKLDPQGRPVEGWDGTFNGNLSPQGNYMWKINATFIDDSPWNGSDIGEGEFDTMGTVTLIR